MCSFLFFKASPFCHMILKNNYNYDNNKTNKNKTYKKRDRPRSPRRRAAAPGSAAPSPGARGRAPVAARRLDIKRVVKVSEVWASLEKKIYMHIATGRGGVGRFTIGPYIHTQYLCPKIRNFYICYHLFMNF